ncbi:MAG TPA: hypothetical protein PLD10_15965 [Rhodopila sp.]|nr:hypothetical protein [Rhodopila sp.]
MRNVVSGVLAVVLPCVVFPIALTTGLIALMLALCGRPHLARNQNLADDLRANAALGGFPAETISRRSGRAADAGRFPFHSFCWLLDFLIGPHHCYASEQPGTTMAELWPWSNNFTYPDYMMPPGGDPAPPSGSV